MPHSTNYFDTLILPAPDTKASAAKVPDKPESVAGMQYALIADAPYSLTSDDVFVSVRADRKAIPMNERDDFRTEFFAKGQPCFRASPLPKTHGWAIHSDAQGRVALVNPDSARFDSLMSDDNVVKTYAMRNAR